MKKVFTLLPIVAVIAACSSTPKDDYDKRAAAVESKRELQRTKDMNHMTIGQSRHRPRLRHLVKKNYKANKYRLSANC